MKTRNYIQTSIRTFSVVLFLAFSMFSTLIYAEASADSAAGKKSSSFALYHSALGTGNHLVKATLSSRTEDGRTVLTGKKVKFVGGADMSVVFGESKTNDQGIASFTIPKEKLPAADAEGNLTIGAKFDGDSLYEATEDQTVTKKLFIELTPNEADSVKTITVKAYSLGAAGEKVILTSTDIFLYVPRMFSYLKVGEGSLDSTGTATFEFPAGIPGDSIGNLTVIARVEEHDVFGNAEGQTTVKWGVPTQLFIKGTYRALWSQIAPTWMIVTLIILLVGVWGHYTYAVVKLLQIKKEAQKLQS